MKNHLKKYISMAVIAAFLFSGVPLVAPAQDNVGKLRGFVYGDDGKKPLKAAVVLLRETTSERMYESEKTGENGAYGIENILPGTYAIGIQWDDKDFNVDALIKIEPKKQIACFTLPKLQDKPGYQVLCKSPKCFFVTPWGWALVGAAAAAVIYGVTKVVEEEVSPTGK